MALWYKHCPWCQAYEMHSIPVKMRLKVLSTTTCLDSKMV